MSGGPTEATSPALTGIVVHWHNEEQLARLVDSWPDDARFELLVVDNGSDGPLPTGPARILDAGGNRGFAGGANLGLREARAPWVLLLNPDARPLGDALEALLEGRSDHPDAAGLAPRLLGDGGDSQHGWQLRPLPSVGTLLLQTLMLPAGGGPAAEPEPGTEIEQPAAAALALDRTVVEELGGLDEGFYPAWFEDVDLARRLRDAGHRIVYWPAAAFRHDLGATVPSLGYGRFLWIYYRNLCRYLAKHHGAGAAALAHVTTVAGMLGRLVLLPLRRPRRAASRSAAARGLLATALGALSGWRRPRAMAKLVTERSL